MSKLRVIERTLPPDSRDRCPKCGSGDVARAEVQKGAFHGYGPVIAVCRGCRALWEPVHHDLLWDPDDPLCSFSEPCDNCAFRPGSKELRDRNEWAKIKDNIEHGDGFYCHKGVPIEAGAEHGYAYPMREVEIEIGGVKTKANVLERNKARLCKGWLNAWGAKMDKERAP